MDPCIFGDEQERKQAREMVRMVPTLVRNVNRLKEVLFGNGREGMLHDVTVLKERQKLLLWLMTTTLGAALGGLALGILRLIERG